MPRRTAPQLRSLATLLFCCAGFMFSSIGYAETADDLVSRLNKLGYEQGETVERIQNYRVDGWNYLDNKHILIYAGASKRFLITTLIDCPDLSSAERIGFTSTTSALTKFDKLVVGGADGMTHQCPIADIKKLRKLPEQS